MTRFEEDANGRDASIRKGELFEIALSETRTAGFKWMMEKGGDPVIALAGESTKAAPGPAGGAGMHLWQFRAMQEGTATLLLRHRRPWESAEAAGRVFQMQIRVTE
jgi:predicted secreted protein